MCPRSRGSGEGASLNYVPFATALRAGGIYAALRGAAGLNLEARPLRGPTGKNPARRDRCLSHEDPVASLDFVPLDDAPDFRRDFAPAKGAGFPLRSNFAPRGQWIDWIRERPTTPRGGVAATKATGARRLNLTGMR